MTSSDCKHLLFSTAKNVNVGSPYRPWDHCWNDQALGTDKFYVGLALGLGIDCTKTIYICKLTLWKALTTPLIWWCNYNEVVSVYRICNILNKYKSMCVQYLEIVLRQKGVCGGLNPPSSGTCYWTVLAHGLAEFNAVLGSLRVKRRDQRMAARCVGDKHGKWGSQHLAVIRRLINRK